MSCKLAVLFTNFMILMFYVCIYAYKFASYLGKYYSA